MDKYIKLVSKTPTEKNSIVGRADSIRHLRNSIVTEKTPLIMLYGKQGVGKTTIVHESLKGLNYVYFDVKNDNDIHENSNYHVIVEEINNNLLDYLQAKGRMSLGTTILVMNQTVELVCETIEVPALTVKQLEEIHPCNQSAVMSNGNIHNFKFYCQFSDVKDEFCSSGDFVTDLLCNPTMKSSSEYFKRTFDDRGYMWSIVHENYLDYPEVDIEKVSDLMTLADMVDTRLYQGNYEMFPLFNMTAIIMPAVHIKGNLKKDKLRPGSCWTKFNNFKMREGKLKSIKHKVSHLDNIELIRKYCTYDKTRALEYLNAYKLTSNDLDVMNHLGIQNKLKPNVMQYFKKILKSSSGSS